MEYKYRMLTPNPFSTQSIQFKLSQSFLQSCVLLSPNKPCESLTYSVSMETIQDHELSPSKNQTHQYNLQKCINDVQLLTKNGFHQSNLYQEKSINQDLNKRSIQQNYLEQNQKRGLQEQNNSIQLQATLINLYDETPLKNKGNFKRKFTLNTSQLINTSIKPTTNPRMGKVMSKIHSTLKESQTTNKIQRNSFKNKQNQQMKRNITQKDTIFQQIRRRKSEHLVYRRHNKQKSKLNQIFYSDRTMQNASRKYQSIDYNKLSNKFNQIRVKNHSTFEPKTPIYEQQVKLKDKNNLEVMGKKIIMTERRTKSILHLRNKSVSQKLSKSDGVQQKQKIRLNLKQDHILENIQINCHIFHKSNSASKVNTEKTQKKSKQSFYL